MLKATRALLSVYDKRGLVELARGLAELGVELLSTGGTYRVLEEEGIPVLPVSEITGFPEILDGRVKTLHPRIHGGILADRGRASHVAALRDHGIAPIDLVVVNLYPFRETAGDTEASVEKIIDMIDVGGPAMVRAAAKNFQGVAVVVDPGDYPQLLAALEEGGGRVPESLRRRLAIKAFRHTQAYDAAIAAWLERLSGDEQSHFPGHLLLDLEKLAEPRYGENPHQQGALYRVEGAGGVFAGFEQLQGKELSFNNLLDADAARTLVARLGEPAAVIVKHGNPCGAGRGGSLREAYERALACDPTSAFGSVVAVNRTADGGLAEAMKGQFVEVVVAPGFDDAALKLHARKRQRRLIRCPVFRPARGDLELRALDGGFLAQTPDHEWDDPAEWRCVTRRQPEGDELRALEFAWQVVRQVRSNAIVIANGDQTVGIGAGQMSRVDSCELAVRKAELPISGCAAASDAFFPFRDGLDRLADAGVTAVVQPGGSKRDADLVTAADERGLAMLLTAPLPPLIGMRRALQVVAALAVVLAAPAGARPAAWDSAPTAATRAEAGDADAWALLRSLRAALDGRPQLAEFEQQFLPAGFSTGERESGRLTLALPDCLRWDYDEPEAKSFLLCGDEVWSWNAGEASGRRFTVDPEQEQGLELLRLGVDAIAERYTARLEAAAEGRAVLLEPRAAGGEITRARLLLTAGEPRLVGLSYQDLEGNTTRFDFSRYRPLPAAALEPPAGIAWIEE